MRRFQKNKRQINFEKSYRCSLQVQEKSWKINTIQVQASNWYSSTPHVYGCYNAPYTVHIYPVSGSIGAYYCIIMVKKLRFWFVDPGLRPQYQLKYRSTIIGDLLFLSSLRKPRSQWVHIVQERKNQLIQPESPALTIAIAIT